MSESNQAKAPLFLGLDLGSISLGLAVIDENGRLTAQSYTRHRGQPFKTALRVLSGLQIPLERIRAQAHTGTGGGRLAELLGGRFVNEVVALSLATARLCPRGAGSLIDIGGEDTKLLWFSGQGAGQTLNDFAMNSLCAAGTGSFLDQQAHRLGYDIARFGGLALKSEVPPRVAGRCSVFAKSDMIHLQQAATPDYEIIYGLCLAMARNIKSSLAKGQELPAPVVFTGGVAANAGMRRALKDIFNLSEAGLWVPDCHFVYGALGAAEAALAAGEESPLNLGALSEFVAREAPNPERLPPLKRRAKEPRTDYLDVSQLPAGRKVPVFIGVDVGSVSTNVVLMTEDGQLAARQYLPTAGRPLEAITQALDNVGREVGDRVEVLGVGATGSGRYLTADFIGADLAINEITAQAAAAAAIDPGVDTIFEIGGQDSKYISLKDGVITDFMMNKACAAGTGSFLEEQAEKLGLNIKGEFGDLALASRTPVAMGERCTVFMDSDLVHHQQRGVETADLTAGLCYSIVANYLGRVVEGREVGQNIFFQGGTSFNQGVAAAFEARLGRPITVPDHADVTGAIGMARLAQARKTWERSSFAGFNLKDRPYKIDSFECRACANRCEIRKVSIEGGEPLFFGSRCEKYEETRRLTPEAPLWPNLFELREQWAFKAPETQSLVQALNRGQRPKRGTMGLMRSMFFQELGPFISTFWACLGYEPVWSEPTNKTLIHKGCELAGGEFCFPVKAAHGHLRDLMDKNPDHIFLPSLVNLPGAPDNAPDAAACPYVQSLAYTAPAAVGLKEPLLLSGPLFFGEGRQPLLKSLIAITRKLGLTAAATRAAADRALAAQAAFQARLKAKGQEILAQLKPGDLALVVVSRPYNGFDPGLNLRLSQKLGRLGVLGLPMDFLDLSVSHDDPAAADHYWRYGQKIMAASKIIGQDPRLNALYITNFGCGPDSFILHLFRADQAGKPYLEIEIDEHSSDVGAITRLEAFLDSLAVRKRLNGGAQAPAQSQARTALSRLRPGPDPRRTLYLPPMCRHVAAVAAVFRGLGFPAEVLPESDPDTVAEGRAFTSGKECYPLVLTIGDFVKLTKRPGFDPARSSLLMPTSNGPCRFGQYSRLLRLTMGRLGLNEVPVVALDQGPEMYRQLKLASPEGGRLPKVIWLAIVATDLLNKALWQTRPYETRAGAADQAFQESLGELIRLFENGAAGGPELDAAMRRARERFEAIEVNGLGPRRPKVALVGEIYVRNNDFSNEDVARKVEFYGGEAALPTFAEWVLYTGEVVRMRAARGRHWRKYAGSWLTAKGQSHLMKRLENHWRGFFPQEREPEVAELLKLASPYLDRSFQGEAVLSLGKSAELCRHGARGVINLMPFTCMPGLVVSSLAKTFRDDHQGLPFLNLAYDGQSQTNSDTRLEAFMHQVKEFAAARGVV